jgi:hypothetical protein
MRARVMHARTRARGRPCKNGPSCGSILMVDSDGSVWDRDGSQMGWLMVENEWGKVLEVGRR